MLIAPESPLAPDIAELIAQHLLDNYEVSPEDSVHAMGAAALAHPGNTLWSARDELTEGLLGIGAIKQHSSVMAEVKSLRTTSAALRRGVATALLSTIISECQSRGVTELSLETGIEDFFAPARALYKRIGFTECEPFASYSADPNSVYLSLPISARLA